MNDPNEPRHITWFSTPTGRRAAYLLNDNDIQTLNHLRAATRLAKQPPDPDSPAGFWLELYRERQPAQTTDSIR